MNGLPDYYGILGVPPTADRDTIRQAYRRLALKHHPDRGGTHEMMLRLNAAFEVLGNPTHREGYDQARAHTDDATLNARAETVSRAAEERAGDYPQDYGEFETWLDGIAADFRNAKYGNSKSSWIPTVKDSSSGCLFIFVGALIGFIWGYSSNIKDTNTHFRWVIATTVGCAWLGRYAHQMVGGMLGGPQNTSQDDLPTAEPVPESPPPNPPPRPEPKARQNSTRSGKDSRLGMYLGTCTNTSFDPPITAQVALDLQDVTASMVEGSIELSGDLGGGSQFVGVIEGGTIRFQTTEAGQFLIEWRGAIDGGNITGDYTARMSDPTLAKDGMATQHGVWRCTKEPSGRS